MTHAGYARAMADLIYLDHAATSWPKADGVSDALAAASRDIVGNAGRSSDDSAANAIDRCRLELARLVRLTDPSRVILTHGCTDALNLAIFGLLAHRRDTPHVVSTVLEHNSVRRPLKHLERAGHISLTEVACDRNGFLDAGAIARACRPATALVACTHASNVVGTIQPVEAIGAAVRAAAPAAMYLVDAAQTVGVLDLSSVARVADLVAFGTHKAIRGPAGLGVLLLGPRVFDPSNPEAAPLQPLIYGGTGESGAADQDDLPRALPNRFEPGTRNPAIAAAVVAALTQLPRDGSTLSHERELLRQLARGLADVPGVRIVGSDDIDKRVGVLAVHAETMSSQEIAAALHASFSIVVRAGVQCAPAAHAALGTAPDGTVRISVGPSNTARDIEQLLDALRRLLG